MRARSRRRAERGLLGAALLIAGACTAMLVTGVGVQPGPRSAGPISTDPRLPPATSDTTARSGGATARSAPAESSAADCEAIQRLDRLEPAGQRLLRAIGAAAREPRNHGIRDQVIGLIDDYRDQQLPIAVSALANLAVVAPELSGAAETVRDNLAVAIERLDPLQDSAAIAATYRELRGSQRGLAAEAAQQEIRVYGTRTAC